MGGGATNGVYGTKISKYTPLGMKMLYSQKTKIENKKAWIQISTLFTCMRGFEPPTPWSVAKCSIQLSYIHTYKD